MRKKLCYYIVASLLAAGLLGTASAQTEFHWNAGGDHTTWDQGANWAEGTPPFTNGTVFRIWLGTGFPTTTPTPIVLGASDIAMATDQVFGPEWGETWNIYGTVITGFGIAPVGAVGGPKTTVNMYGTASVSTHDSIFIGDMFWFAGGPNLDFNEYNSSSIATKYLIVGGHLNLYDSSTAIATNALLIGPAGSGFWGGASSDATRWINLAGGSLTLPTGNSNFVTTLITRGIFLCYGKQFDTNEFTITDNGTNTFITVTNSLGTLNSIAVQAPVTNLMVGQFQPALAYLDAAQSGGGTIAYQSSNPGVVSVSATGVATANQVGTALVSATYTGSTFGSFSSINTVLFTVTPYTNNLIHRYSFSESGGGTTADSVGGSAWDGTLNGGATLGGGTVTLNGIDGYVQLPAGIVSGLDAATIEAWANIVSTPVTSNAWLFAFGDQNAAASPQGRNYIGFVPYTAQTNASSLFGQGDPGFNGEQDATFSLLRGGVANYLGNVHVVCVYNPYAGYVSVYTNGVLAAINNSVTHPLAATLGSDPLNALGASLYAADPFLTGSIDEVRIYSGPLSAAQIAADYALGPNQLIGTSRTVSLSASLSGGNVILSWPTNSALVDVIASPVLGAGATWTSANLPLTVAGGKFQMTVPAIGSARYFRLQQY